MASALAAQMRTALGDDGDARASLLDRKAELVVRDATLEAALTRLTETSGVIVVFSPSLLRAGARTVTCDCKRLSVGDVLDRLLAGTDFDYTVMDGQIALTPKLTEPIPLRPPELAPARFASLGDRDPPHGSALVKALTVRRVHAQPQGSIIGRVTDASTGAGVANANVLLEDTELSTTTDTDGRYRIANVPVGSYTLVVERIGYGRESREVTVAEGAQATVDIALQLNPTTLDEIVAVGYGTQARREVTGSVASIQSAEISRVVTANPVDAIKGRLPGVDIRSLSFEPGAAATVRIRGARSISASNDPLIVVDGVPISGDLRDIDSEDIASIEVLKDAAASAVYGSRAANGVLLVTTKKGSPGQTRIEYSGTYGVSEILRRPDLMNGVEYANFAREAQRAAGNPACADYLSGPTECDTVALDALMRENLFAGVSTDWQDQVLRTGELQNHQVAVSGGSEDTRFRASIGFLDQTGITITQGYTSKTANLSLSHDFGRLNVQGSVIAGQSVREAGRGSGIWDEALFNSPLGRVRDGEGSLIFLPTEDGLRVNPVSDALDNVRDITRTHVLGTIRGAAGGLRPQGQQRHRPVSDARDPLRFVVQLHRPDPGLPARFHSEPRSQVGDDGRVQPRP